MQRRKFLHAAAAAAVAGSAGCGASKSPWRFLTPGEARTLQAICETIVPADQDPGGAQAGVACYIDRQLADHFREHRQAYRDGIAAAERIAGGSFADLPPQRQSELFRELERGAATRAFAALVVTHTMQGFYGSPRHGGNREFVSWRMLAVPISPVRGRANEKG